MTRPPTARQEDNMVASARITRPPLPENPTAVPVSQDPYNPMRTDGAPSQQIGSVEDISSATQWKYPIDAADMELLSSDAIEEESSANDYGTGKLAEAIAAIHQPTDTSFKNIEVLEISGGMRTYDTISIFAASFLVLFLYL